MTRKLILALVAAAALAGSAMRAQAIDVIEDWAEVKAPPAPTLKPVTVDPKTTALLMLDFMNQNCDNRPRCIAHAAGDEEATGRGARRQGAGGLFALSATRRLPT